jgi:hypothetical protein
MLQGQRYIRSTRNNMIAIYAATVIALLLLLLSACGSNAGGQGQAATPTSTPLAQAQKCGTMHSMHAEIVPTDQNIVNQSIHCFWQAFQNCQPATLTYALNGLDAGTVHTFTVKSTNGKCSITDGVQHYIAPHPPGKTTTYTCSDVKLQSDGLYVFSCGGVGTVIVPAK